MPMSAALARKSIISWDGSILSSMSRWRSWNRHRRATSQRAAKVGSTAALSGGYRP
jgi:hypothetical protein